jgi:hypothetical protein
VQSLAQIVSQASDPTGTDDTTNLQALATAFSNSSATKLQLKRDATYVITNIITFDLTNKKHVEIDFNGATIKLNSSFRYFNNGLFTLNFNTANKSTCIIKNCYFDGSGNPPDFTTAAINPNGGRGAFFVNGATKVFMDNCHFNDLFYSACLWSHYATFAKVTNCSGIRVGGRSADNTEDARGDALYFGYLGMADGANLKEASVIVDNCQFSSWTALDNPSGNSSQAQKNACQSGRAGIVFGEFATTGLKKRLKISNSSFYNYQRSIHLENTDNVSLKVENTAFEEYGAVLVIREKTDVNNFTFDNCVFSKTKNVIGIDVNYDFIITGDTSSGNLPSSIKNSVISPNGRIMSYGNGINLVIENTNIEVDTLTLLTNSFVMFHNCQDVKFNSSNIWQSGIHFVKCNVTGGYKLDANSKNFLMGTSASTLPNQITFLIKDSIFTNVVFRYPSNSKILIDNCQFTLDNNFSPVDALGTTRSCFLPVNNLGIDKITKSKFINTRTTGIDLFDSGNGMVFTDPLSINDSYFQDVKISVVNTSPNYEVSIANSRFKTTGLVTYFVNGFGSYISCKNSDFVGLASGEFYNFTNGLKYNCYRLASGVATAL